jgi:REP element-mobilizing transposase RayT
MRTRWHITFGTYAARLHGGEKPTTDRRHNRFGEPQIVDDPVREYRERRSLLGDAVLLTPEQQRYVQTTMPELCRRGSWDLVECSAASNHVHVVVDVDPEIHGKRVRALLKRWLTQAFDERWARPKRSDGMSWWAEGGSARAVRGHEYREVVKNYVQRQRAPEAGDPRSG